MPHFHIKKFLISFLLVGFLFQFAPIFPASAAATSIFEINYPSMPGAETPQQIQAYPEAERLPHYINYFLRLFFIIAIGVAAAVVAFGGILYLVSRGADKPALLSLASARINQGLLGLLIIVVSYLVLAIINPQLLVFKAMSPDVPKEITLTPSPFENVITFVKVPVGCLIDRFLKDINTKTAYDKAAACKNCNEVNINTYKKDGKNFVIDGDSFEIISDGNFVYKIELPLVEALALLDRAMELNKKIVEELKNCKCGKSKYHIGLNESGKIDCLGGLGIIGGWLEEQCKKAKDANGNDILDKDNMSFCAEICANKCKNCGNGDEGTFGDRNLSSACATTTLKAYREELGEIMVRLNTKDIAGNAAQIKLLRDTLGANSSEFLTRELDGYNYQEDFNALEKKFKEQDGYEVVSNALPQFPTNCKATDPFTFYAPIENEVRVKK
jgi:hypothetical protein